MKHPQANAVSVCIPAHNEESTIAQTIQSVLSQRWPAAREVEVLVGANGCSDGTHTEVERVQSENPDVVRLLEILENRKPNAWNALLREASPEYVVFIDGDVEVDVRAFSELVAMLEARSDLIIARARTQRCEKGGG